MLQYQIQFSLLKKLTKLVNLIQMVKHNQKLTVTNWCIERKFLVVNFILLIVDFQIEKDLYLYCL